MPRRPSNVLQVRVNSPRLAWLGFLGILGRVSKLGFLVAVLAAIGWAGHQGYKHVVLDNPDFQLRVIDLNANPVLDEPGLVELTGIDLTSNLTRVDSPAIRETLLAHPAITTARIERHMPDTLVVRITTREPRAWLAVPDADIPVNRATGAMLIDGEGTPYPCPELQLEEALKLPVISLKHNPAHPLTAGAPVRHEDLNPCIRLLDHITLHSPDLLEHIDTLSQPNAWSIRAVTRDGTRATFGLREHPRQLTRLRAALEHAGQHNTPLATINLIPRENIPITLQSTPPVPLRAIPVNETAGEEPRQNRGNGDLEAILNRN